MKLPKLSIVVAAFCLTSSAVAQQMTALSCNDYRPTIEAIESFPDLVGACEGIVDRDGDLHAKFTAVMRRVSGNNVTLFLPATKVFGDEVRLRVTQAVAISLHKADKS